MTEEMTKKLDDAAMKLQWSTGQMLLDKETLKPADPATTPLERLVSVPVPSKIDVAVHFGANWYRNNVWHSPKEEPEQGMALTIIEDDGTLTASYTMLEGGMNWEKIKDIDGCKCWAYCEDLLPMEGYNARQVRITLRDDSNIIWNQHE